MLSAAIFIGSAGSKEWKRQRKRHNIKRESAATTGRKRLTLIINKVREENLSASGGDVLQRSGTNITPKQETE